MTPGKHTDDLGNEIGDEKNDDTTGITDNDIAPQPDLPLDSGAYVLNALTEDENNLFEAHLAESETTRNEVTELTDVAVLLGLAAEPVQPSPGLKINLMAMLSSTPQLSRDIPPVRTLQTPAPSMIDDVPDVADPTTPTHPAPLSEPGETPGLLPVRSPLPVEPPAALSGKVQQRWFSRPLIALASVAAAVALIVGSISLTNALGETSFQQQQADQLAAINSSEDLQQLSADVSTGGKATLVWSADLGKSALIMDGLAALPSDKTYELWYIDADGTPTKAGLLDVDSEQEWRVLDGALTAGATVGVTVEPRGGSTAPTTTPIVAISAA